MLRNEITMTVAHQFSDGTLGKTDRSKAVRTAGQQGDDDVNKSDPVGKIRPETKRKNRVSQ